MQTTLKMFLRQCTLRLVRSAKFPLGGGTKVFLARGLLRHHEEILGWFEAKRVDGDIK